MKIFNYSEEIRDGYTINADMKKVWAVCLDLLSEFDRVCKKHHLRYFAAYGALLGAVREKGFIPWDDDIDLCMFRDDYEKLKLIAPTEFTGKYYFQDWYNSYGRTWSFSKLRNSETTGIEFPDKGPEFNQGIFIDISALDEYYEEGKVNAIFKQLQMEIFQCINNPTFMLQRLIDGKEFTMDKESVIELCQNPIEAQHLLEDLTLENYGQTDRVAYFVDEMRRNNKYFSKHLFDEIIDMPFENTTIPVPLGYNEILTIYYGDYMTPIQAPNNHTEHIILDPYKPYRQWLEEHQSK